MYEYDDFYNEPSEFEMQIDEFKESLMNSVKDEYKAVMERLMKENAELQEVKRNFDQIKREFNQKTVELDMEKSDLRNKIRRERLKDLMKDFEVILYTAYSRRKSGPKCDKCDENRRIYYTTPTGRETYEECNCKNSITYYEPQKNVCSSFASRNGKFIAWYKPFNDEDVDGYSYESSTAPKFIYSGEKFEDVPENRWTVYFKTEEECQAYCDWLTAKEGKGR
jgi:hypothetical protein